MGPPPEPVPPNVAAASSVPWKDPRFFNGVEKVRTMCGVPAADREDDALIGMMLDRFKWDYAKAADMYKLSVKRRRELGLPKIKHDIISRELRLEEFPHHQAVMPVIPIFASTSLKAPASSSAPTSEATQCTGTPPAPPVIGCYEMRYGQGDPSSDKDSLVTPADFTDYMLYVTQWRWIQCERYARAHGELGFWSMIHDLSCPTGFMSLWSKSRAVFNNYLKPVEEACGGLFPPMVQKILIINVPTLFSPVWSIVSTFLPQQHKERIVLLTTSKTTAKELKRYMPEEHLPPHVPRG